jgi:hypothetical protein
MLPLLLTLLTTTLSVTLSTATLSVTLSTAIAETYCPLVESLLLVMVTRYTQCNSLQLITVHRCSTESSSIGIRVSVFDFLFRCVFDILFFLRRQLQPPATRINTIQILQLT